MLITSRTRTIYIQLRVVRVVRVHRAGLYTRRIQPWKPDTLSRLRASELSFRCRRSGKPSQAKKLDNTNTLAHAKTLAAAQYVQKVVQKQAEQSSEMSSLADVIQAVTHILRRGSRWADLMNAIESIEILLIDQDEDTRVGDIIEFGDEGFERAKALLLARDCNIKDVCSRLSDVSEMIIDLAEPRKDSEIRRYLSIEINRRTRNVFGTWIDLGGENNLGLGETLISRPQSDIVDIFGIRIEFTRAPPE